MIDNLINRMKIKRDLCFIISLILLLIIIFCIYKFFELEYKPLNNPISFEDVIVNNLSNEKYAKIDNISSISELYWEKIDNTKSHYYLAHNVKDNLWYIIKCGEKLPDYLKDIEIISNDQEDETKNVSITGMTATITDSKKEDFMEYINYGLSEEEKLIEEEFNSIFGKLYLEEGKTPKEFQSTLIGISIFIGIILIFPVINYFGFKANIKLIEGIDREEIDKINDEIKKNNFKEFKISKVIDLKNYLISKNLGLNIIKYTDIDHITNVLDLMNGSRTGQHILLTLRNGAEIKLGQTSNNNKGKEEFDDLLNTILNKINNN